jgi:hypothetical protein
MTFGRYAYGSSTFGGLILPSGTGSLHIISTPPGASILIDNVLQTGTTPSIITDIIEGPHNITITMPGFNDYTIPVVIEAGGTTTIPIVTLTPNEGCIYFTTNPPGASIYIDDILRAEVTPALICGLTLDPHTYRLILEGYLDITGNVDLTSGQGTNISQDLEQVLEAGFGGGGMLMIIGLAVGYMFMSKK